MSFIDRFLNEASASLRGTNRKNLFCWRCPRCQEPAVTSRDVPAEGHERAFFDAVQMLRCTCGYSFGIDPDCVYARCECGHLVGLVPEDVDEETWWHCGSGCWRGHALGSELANYCTICKKASFRHKNPSQVPRPCTHDVKHLRDIVQFAGRLESAVEPIFFEKLANRIQRQQNRLVAGRGGQNPRRVVYRRVITTPDGSFAEELIIEN